MTQLLCWIDACLGLLWACIRIERAVCYSKPRAAALEMPRLRTGAVSRAALLEMRDGDGGGEIGQE
jgi:hypothetical protein